MQVLCGLDDLGRLGAADPLLRDDLAERVGLQPEPLVLGEVPLEDVDADVGRRVQLLQDPSRRVVLAPRVEVQSALGHRRRGLHAPPRNAPLCSQVVQDLAGGAERPRRRRRGDDDVVVDLDRERLVIRCTLRQWAQPQRQRRILDGTCGGHSELAQFRLDPRGLAAQTGAPRDDSHPRGCPHPPGRLERGGLRESEPTAPPRPLPLGHGAGV